jgi:hypothetical protein
MSALIASLGAFFAGFRDGLSLQALLSLGSAGLTAYFWLVKARRDRAGLRLVRLGDFRPDRPQCSDVPGTERAVWYGGICLANPSTLPAVVVQVRVQLHWQGRWLDGRLVLEKKDDVPWAVEPLRVLSRSLGCAFLVKEGTAREELARPQRLRFTLVTVDGRAQALKLVTCDAAPAAPEALAA